MERMEKTIMRLKGRRKQIRSTSSAITAAWCRMADELAESFYMMYAEEDGVINTRWTIAKKQTFEILIEDIENNCADVYRQYRWDERGKLSVYGLILCLSRKETPPPSFDVWFNTVKELAEFPFSRGRKQQEALMHLKKCSSILFETMKGFATIKT